MNTFYCFTRPAIIGLFFLLVAVAANAEDNNHQQSGRPAIITERQTVMPTYPFSDPNPVAKPGNLYYPYFRFDGYATHSMKKEWKVIEMENDFIKLSVFPEIGGKIWGAMEKSTGREFIYYNHVVKFRDIAMRGPWTSGGIEFNFGIIGHVPTSSTPVDYLTRTKEDGSVSCFVSSLELITRTIWTVEVNLPKDKAYFTTRTTWSNTSQIDQPYYQWMNAGYKASGNIQFCYPGENYIGHEGDVHSFPIDEKGRDISFYANNNFGADKSFHVLGKYSDFYGAYWHEDDFGSVHHAPYDEKLGKKIFLWGQARDGGIWEDLLTDTDGQYVELQSGRMFNQPSTGSAYTPFKHFSFIPGATDEWTEYWFPVKGTGGLSKVSASGSLHVVRKEDNIEVKFSPLQKINTTLTVRSGDKELHNEHLSLDVMETWMKIFAVSSTERPLTVEIGDKELVWNEDVEREKLSRPTAIPSDFDWKGMYGQYVTGEQYMNQKIYDKAENAFINCLEKNPYYIPALNKMASLCYRTGRYEIALSYATTSLSLDTYDGEANYLYGLINFRLGNDVDAKDGFSIASYSLAYRSNAYALLAKCFLKEKNWKKAIHYSLQALKTNNLNQDAIQVILVAYRYSGQKNDALKMISDILKTLPLNHPVRFESALLSGQSENLNDFTTLIRNELPDETYQEMALWYFSSGLFDEALTLLAHAENNPIAMYNSAYITHLAGEKEESDRLLEKANALPADLVFPFRHEHLKILEWAASTSSSFSWKCKYYTAILNLHLGNKIKALDMLNECEESDYAPLFLTRAALKTGNARLKDILKSEQLDNSWRVGMELMKYYFEDGKNDLAMQTGKRYSKKFPANYMIGLKYAKALQLNGKYDECISLLRKLQVLPNEGSYEGRAVYKEANLYQAINFLSRKNYKSAIRSVENSKEWIENLGVGKPYEESLDTRLEDFILATIYEKLNEQTKAKEYYQKISVQTRIRRFNSSELLTALTLRKLNREQEANDIAKNWLAKNPDNKIAQWCTAIYNGDESIASGLISERYSVEESTPWEAVSNDYNFNIIVELFKSMDM